MESSRARWPQENNSYKSCNWISVGLVCIVKSTSIQSDHSRNSVQLYSHAYTYLVCCNVLVVHNHGHLVDIYGFDKETRQSNASTEDAVIAYKDPVVNSTVIIMINQAIKIDSMSNILICPMQRQGHGTIVNKCP